MNPPITPLDGDMFHELMSELRHVRDQIDRVKISLDEHIRDETQDFREVRDSVSRISDDVSSLKTKLGMIAGVAGLLGAGLIQSVVMVFF